MSTLMMVLKGRPKSQDDKLQRKNLLVLKNYIFINSLKNYKIELHPTMIIFLYIDKNKSYSNYYFDSNYI